MPVFLEVLPFHFLLSLPSISGTIGAVLLWWNHPRDHLHTSLEVASVHHQSHWMVLWPILMRWGLTQAELSSGVNWNMPWSLKWGDSSLGMTIILRWVLSWNILSISLTATESRKSNFYLSWLTHLIYFLEPLYVNISTSHSVVLPSCQSPGQLLQYSWTQLESSLWEVGGSSDYY